MVFSDPHISISKVADASSLVTLLNSAYRGESSKNGWTSEAHLISGEVRTDEGTVTGVLQKHQSVILKYEVYGIIYGCVNLQVHQGKLYLGMFAVSPQAQGGGIGKKLLKASELYAADRGCTVIYMTVISVRTELIDWYKRHGYKDTGERKPFDEDGISGRHLQPLQFLVLEKEVC